MIIFYNKNNGEVIGTIEGRMHDEAQLNVSMGVTGVDSKDIQKIVCQWVVGKLFDSQKNEITKEKADELRKKKKDVFVEFEPDHKQKELFIEFDKKPTEVYKYKVDSITNELIKK